MIERLLAHPRVASTIAALSTQYKNLSSRERSIIGVLVVIAGLMGAWGIYEPVAERFREQWGRLEKTLETVKTSSASLERYTKLKARRDMIEREYRGVEIKEGAYAHLENLIRTKLGLSGGFTIKDSSPKSMGGNFEQITYTVKFSTPTLQPMVDLLKEVVNGQRPLLLSSLEVVKTRRGDSLDATFEVVSIRESSGAVPAAK
jgi:hypothetical protein